MKRYISKGITPEIAANLEEIAKMRDEDIDLSDMPEVTDWSNAVRGKFYRPVKQQLTLRLDADVVHWFKTHADGAKGYQTKINAALRQFVDREIERERRA
ncbi:MAG: BrnA antitoxin family protein [Qipengyuania sp.]|jgi:uncharacterized protein (DUF4415 family)|nr:BrnA antitoxin family protein [Qipengyuania sp.]